MKLGGFAKQASEEWAAAPLGWYAGYVRCLVCRCRYMSVHPAGMKLMECPSCKAMTKHTEED